MIDDWKLLKTTDAFKDNVLTVTHKRYRYEKIDSEMDFTVVTISSWATIVPITEDGDFIIVKQFRAGNEKDTLEFPGGSINVGEAPLKAAKRELKEETGVSSANFTPLGVMQPNPAFMDNSCHVFLALDCSIDSKQNLDLFEDAEMIKVSSEQFKEMILTGEFSQSISLAAYALYLSKKKIK